jgi:integrase
MPICTDTPRVPSYRRHRPTGQAVVTLNGRDFYLGKWNTKASRAEYDRLIGEWLAAGRNLVKPGGDLTINELARDYWSFCKGYYRKPDGRPTGTLGGVRVALRLLRETYGATLVGDFGPLALEALQLRLIDKGFSRSTVNAQVAMIRRTFRWGVAKERVSPTVYQALAALPGLRKGRSAAREPRPVRPVADGVVDATLPHLPAVVADMVRFQRLTGARPNEVCILRPCDLEISGDVWTYRPQSHKTDYQDGRERVIAVGPKAQDAIRKYLLRDKRSYCFAPSDSEKKRLAVRHAGRRTPLSCGNRPGSNRKRSPKRHAGEHYTTDSYGRAVERAVMIANRKRTEEAIDNGGKPELLPDWRPNQLRHTRATEIRKQFGLEAAQVTLGHSQADITQIYAERDLSLAFEVARKIG